MADAPHLTLPFRLDGARFAEAEQDTDAELLACLRLAIAVQPGELDVLPEVGTPDLAFRQGGFDLDELQAIVESLDARLDVLFTRDDAGVTALLDTIRASLRRRAERSGLEVADAIR